jgi:hypothetical protein
MIWQLKHDGDVVGYRFVAGGQQSSLTARAVAVKLTASCKDRSLRIVSHRVVIGARNRTVCFFNNPF